MKFIKSINELNEARQAPAKTLFKMVVKGSTSEIEGVKISKEMAQAALDWFDGSVYARKYAKQVKTAGMGAVAPLIFGDNWGIKKRIPSKLKAEFKELEAQYKRVRPENESFLTEADATPTMMLAQEIEGAEFHHGFGDGAIGVMLDLLRKHGTMEYLYLSILPELLRRAWRCQKVSLK